MSRPVSLLTALLLASTAQAAIYENAITIDSEDDLYALEQRGDISSDTLETLLELFREGVDLNSASRDALYELPGLTYPDVDAILAYRKAKGRIEDPAELVGAAAITAEQLLTIAPFIRIDAAASRLPVSGRVRAVGAVTATDNVPPPAILIARVKGPWDLSAGAMLATTRRDVFTPSYLQLVDTLVTPGFGYQLNAPRLFAQWQSGSRRVVVGTFSMGFGERLTLDNTRHFTPHGIYLSDDFRRPPDLSRTCKLSSSDPVNGACAGEVKNLYVTPDFTWRDAFRGVAGSLEDVSLGGEASLSAYGFLSYQTKSIYQYELYDRRACSDPRSTDAACAAPPVYVNEGLSTGQTKVVYATLPYLYDELAAGAHVDLKPSFRWRFGLTGYGANPMFHATPMLLDFQEWSHTPGGGSYGAVGLDGQATSGQLTFGFEGTRSFDHAVGGAGGGFGAVQRTTWSPKHHELELSLRYYDNNFANPNARPVSAPDQYDGQRARNELGARLRYFGHPNRDLQLQGRADFWVLPFSNPKVGPAGMANLYALARVDFVGSEVFQPAVWIDARNRNLASNEHGRCASGTIVYVEGEPFTCNGDLYRLAARLEVRPLSKLALIAQGWFTLTDDRKYTDTFRKDVMFWGEVRYQALDILQLRLRSRYLFQDITDNTYLEQSLWNFLEVAWAPKRGTEVSVRYDLLVWLDARASTKTRVPNPENRFLLDARTTF